MSAVHLLSERARGAENGAAVLTALGRCSSCTTAAPLPFFAGRQIGRIAKFEGFSAFALCSFCRVASPETRPAKGPIAGEREAGDRLQLQCPEPGVLKLQSESDAMSEAAVVWFHAPGENRKVQKQRKL